MIGLTISWIIIEMGDVVKLKDENLRSMQIQLYLLDGFRRFEYIAEDRDLKSAMEGVFIQVCKFCDSEDIDVNNIQAMTVYTIS